MKQRGRILDERERASGFRKRVKEGKKRKKDIPPGPALGIGVSLLMKRDVAGPVPLRMSTARIVGGMMMSVCRVQGESNNWWLKHNN